MDTSYHSMFDEIVRINNIYNTLVLYEGRHYHAANHFFGKTLKDARLTQFFCQKNRCTKNTVHFQYGDSSKYKFKCLKLVINKSYLVSLLINT
jgi:hypothetical protein